MYASEGPSLVLEDFGTDIRPYLNQESTVLKNELHQLVGAIQALHTCGYVHCDLKPQNVLCKDRGFGKFELKLCDLDSATKIGEPFSTRKFTLQWVSPEVYLAFKEGLEAVIAHQSLDMFHFGALTAAFLGSTRHSEMYVLPELEEELMQVFRDQLQLNALMPCGGRLDYKFWVEKMCSLNPRERPSFPEVLHVVTNDLKRTGLMHAVDTWKEKADITGRIDAIDLDVKRIGGKMDTLLLRSEEMRRELQKGFGQLRRAVFAVSQRTCPTTICILGSKEDQSTGESVSRLLGLLRALSDPVAALQAQLVAACKNSYRMTLVCECCIAPQLNKGAVYPLAITEPKDMGSLLMYASMTLTAAKGLNLGLKIAKLFVPLVPTMPDGTIAKISAFTESLGQGTLEGMPEVQRRVAAALTDNDSGSGSGGCGCGDGNASVSDTDYCKRQFETFLAQQDPHRDFAGLNRVQGEDGFVFYVCAECVHNYEAAPAASPTHAQLAAFSTTPSFAPSAPHTPPAAPFAAPVAPPHPPIPSYVALPAAAESSEHLSASRKSEAHQQQQLGSVCDACGKSRNSSRGCSVRHSRGYESYTSGLGIFTKQKWARCNNKNREAPGCVMYHPPMAGYCDAANKHHIDDTEAPAEQLTVVFKAVEDNHRTFKLLDPGLLLGAIRSRAVQDSATAARQGLLAIRYICDSTCPYGAHNATALGGVGAASEVVLLMGLQPSLGRKGLTGGVVDPGDAAAAGAKAIYYMVYSHAPNKQFFLEAGAEEMLRSILANEETSNAAKSLARLALMRLGLQA